MRILVVEDNVWLAENLIEVLTQQGYTVDWLDNGESVSNQIKLIPYDLMILDILLPCLDGFQVCQQLRQSNWQVPILMLTARNTLMDKVQGLDAGADDYLSKPFEMEELLARVRALLRRGQAQACNNLTWGQLQLNPATYEVYYGTHALNLTAKEFQLMELLLMHGRRVLSRSVIIEHCWSAENPPEEETVKAHIKTLRQKLRMVGAANLIETVHGRGYRLMDRDSE